MTTKERKEFMISYLKLKVEEQNWHGVADAAMDLREIEVELSFKQQMEIIPYKVSNEFTKSDLENV